MSKIKESVIKTKSIGRGIAKTTKVMLELTATTALVFYPEVHEGGVRGNLVRFRKIKTIGGKN